MLLNLLFMGGGTRILDGVERLFELELIAGAATTTARTCHHRAVS